MEVVIAFFCNKVIEEGDRRCHHLLFLLKHKKECNRTFFFATPPQKK
jgi:hypothetical protein